MQTDKELINSLFCIRLASMSQEGAVTEFRIDLFIDINTYGLPDPYKFA